MHRIRNISEESHLARITLIEYFLLYYLNDKLSAFFFIGSFASLTSVLDNIGDALCEREWLVGVVVFNKFLVFNIFD